MDDKNKKPTQKVPLVNPPKLTEKQLESIKKSLPKKETVADILRSMGVYEKETHELGDISFSLGKPVFSAVVREKKTDIVCRYTIHLLAKKEIMTGGPRIIKPTPGQVTKIIKGGNGAPAQGRFDK